MGSCLLRDAKHVDAHLVIDRKCGLGDILDWGRGGGVG